MKKLLFILFVVSSINLIGQNHYVVTTNTDHYPAQQGELRWAIKEANAHPGLDYIDFNIPQTPPVAIQFEVFFPHTVSSSGAAFLLDITDPLQIDGNTQPGSNPSGNPKIEFKGFYNQTGHSMQIFPAGSGSVIKNLTFSNATNTSWNGGNTAICIRQSSNNIIQDCVFHTNGNGFGSGASILIITGSSVTNNNQIKGNYFGTDRNKINVLPIKSAITVLSGSGSGNNTCNIIGGSAASDKNYIYNCGFNWAIMVDNSCLGYKVQNNVFINNKKNIDLAGWSGCLSANMCKTIPIITKAEISGNSITVEGTSQPNDYVEIYKTNIAGIDAEYIISSAIANISGNWTFTVPKGGLVTGDLMIGTATDLGTCNTSEFGRMALLSNPCAACPSQSTFTYTPTPVFFNQVIQFTSTNTCSGTTTYSWDFGDFTSGVNNTSTQKNPTHTFANTGNYIVKLTTTLSGCTSIKAALIRVGEAIPPCENCIGSFAPEAGKYILSAWVKEENAAPSKPTYDRPQIKVFFPTNPATPDQAADLKYTCVPAGAIIDGWQRVETEIEVLSTYTYINLQLNSTTGNSFFDDIRIFPKDGSMTSYVYDPQNLRLVAELDERNYATMYEYDEEGKLVRVKKETEKGVMTIKENKNNTKKK